MARSAECRCESNFTCGHCLRNAKPWHYTFANGSAIVGDSFSRFECKPPKQRETDDGPPVW